MDTRIQDRLPVIKDIVIKITEQLSLECNLPDDEHLINECTSLLEKSKKGNTFALKLAKDVFLKVSFRNTLKIELIAPNLDSRNASECEKSINKDLPEGIEFSEASYLPIPKESFDLTKKLDIPTPIEIKPIKVDEEHGDEEDTEEQEPDVTFDIDSPDKAISALEQGNKRFVNGESEHPHTSLSRLEETKDSQDPFAIVLSCSDSRVPVEIIFDQGIGDIFTVRVAGNICSADEIDSIWYALIHLNPQVIVVLGHTHCGAVTAAVKHIDSPEQTPKIIQHIFSSVEKARTTSSPLDENKLIQKAVGENVWNSVHMLLRNKSIPININAGRLKLVGAVYDIETGKVEFLGEASVPNDDSEDDVPEDSVETEYSEITAEEIDSPSTSTSSEEEKELKCPECDRLLDEDEISDEHCDRCDNSFWFCPRCKDTIGFDPDETDENSSICPHCEKPLGKVKCDSCNEYMWADSEACPSCSETFKLSECPHCDKPISSVKGLDECPYCDNYIYLCPTCNQFVVDDPEEDGNEECPLCEATWVQFECPDCNGEIFLGIEECPDCGKDFEYIDCPGCDAKVPDCLNECPACNEDLE